jgi:dienelactone hydrolase
LNILWYTKRQLIQIAGNVWRVNPDDSSVKLTIQDWPYRDQDTPLTGVLCRDESVPGARPGILLIHGGAGLDEHAREQARRYAALGYVVLACDMYGDGVAGDRDRIISCATALRDNPALTVRRAQAGLAALSGSPGVDGRAAAIGFCFGGMVALTLARAGEPIAGAVSIHGSLATSSRAQPGAVRARVLACHGALDPHVPPGDVTAFAEEMNDAAADWQLIMYGGAVHGFTHAHAVPGAVPGVAYDPRADSRSFTAACGFLAEIFAAGN